MCGADQYSTEGAVYCEDCPEGTGDVAPGEGTSVDDCRSEEFNFKLDPSSMACGSLCMDDNLVM